MKLLLGMSALVAIFFLGGCTQADIDHDGVVRIYCLGDSNTDAVWQGMNWPYTPRWCEKTAALCGHIRSRGALLPAEFKNVAYYGATARDQHRSWRDAPWQTRAAAEGHADGVVMLFGTVDITGLGATPGQLVADLAVACARNPKIPCYVGTQPATVGENVDPAPWADAIRAQFGQHAIDMTSGIVPVAPGTVHIDDASQDRIADRVRTVLGCEP
jgi:hypothetical protein